MREQQAGGSKRQRPAKNQSRAHTDRAGGAADQNFIVKIATAPIAIGCVEPFFQRPVEMGLEIPQETGISNRKQVCLAKLGSIAFLLLAAAMGCRQQRPTAR